MQPQELKFNWIYIDFECLFDPFINTVKYLRRKYPKSKYYAEGFDEWSDYFLELLSLTREERNPFCTILDEQYKDQADNLFSELYKKNWKEVLEEGTMTDLFKVMHDYATQSGFKVQVNCHHLQEQLLIEDLHLNWDATLDIERITKFSSMYIYDIKQTISSFNEKQLFKKAIYVYYQKINFANYKKKILIPEASLLMNANKVLIINPYSGTEIPDDIDLTPNDIMEVESNGSKYSLR